MYNTFPNYQSPLQYGYQPLTTSPQLQLQNATAGMLKFPQAWTYGAGPFPPIFGGCCGQANI